jgi:hypothetical protein
MSAIFAIKQNGELKKFTVNRKKVNIPGFGVMSAEDFVQNRAALEYVLTHESHQHILSEVIEEQAKPAETAPKAKKKTTKP